MGQGPVCPSLSITVRESFSVSADEMKGAAKILARGKRTPSIKFWNTTERKTPSGLVNSPTWKVRGRTLDVGFQLEPCAALQSQRKVWQCIMAGSKRIKCGCAPKSEVRQGGTPSPGIRLGGDPDSIMKEHPILAAGIL